MSFTATAPLTIEPLYRRYAGFVRGALARLSAPPTELDDLAQEVFVQLQRKQLAFDDERAARAWLFQTARRLAANARRGHRRRDARHQRHAPEPWAPPCPERWASWRRGQATLEAFVAELPADQRQVFELSERQGLSAPEIAARTGDNLNTIYARIRRLRGRWVSRVVVAVLVLLSMLTLLSPRCATTVDSLARGSRGVGDGRAALPRGPARHG